MKQLTAQIEQAKQAGLEKWESTNVRRWLLPLIYLALGIGAIASYAPMKSVMIVQTAWINIVESPVTLNFFFIFVFWGLAADRYTKKMAKWKGWAIWAGGQIAIMLFFRIVGGYKTLWG